GVRVSRLDAHSHVPSGLPAAQPVGQEGSVGGHEEGPGHPAARRHLTREAYAGARAPTPKAVNARFISVAVPVPTLGMLTYSVPGECAVPETGARVVVPLGTRQLTGIVLGAAPAPDGRVAVKDIVRVLEEGAFVPPDVVAITSWVA